MNTPELLIDGAVATIRLRRPEQANRLGPDDLAQLSEHIATVNATEAVLVLRLLASGKSFCSGYDIGSLAGDRALVFDEVVNALEDARPVTLALLQGGVYGGATDLALACDFRLGVPGIEMFMPAARLGLHFYQRGLERYVSRLGLDTAKRLLLTAERIDAGEMKAIGFLTHLVAAEALQSTAEGLTKTLTSMAPLAVLGMKKHLNRIATSRLDGDEFNRDMLRAAQSADFQEGRASWAEKRPPKFTGQ
ncbi:enoyl-CoA hydratase/isomerase family protein [Aquabacterium sp.]|uniref:enoyl-CoA hydratase/isomerase family protein n=1 Tax=Aquabacterium sp. TaxID=1872578 RepID=UPI002CFC77A7|nr:enoyl-CoA hydratase-related protein [Aquabacterium sp.]HSW08993.1 enoyl-CoA hydratase-related protein [Aquabacterium sp.]